jgi:Brp/Blh family beta-carotene 15,15'-monooxygenase
MSMPQANGGDAASWFRERAFRRLPLVCLAAAGAAAAVAGASWSEALGPLPWIISLGFVGLPHGATDFAASRRAWRGWSLAAVWLAYAAAMATTAAVFVTAPRLAITAFAALSCWHFGAAHRDTDAMQRSRPRAVAALARGCAVLAMPLAAWPDASAAAARDLAALAIGPVAARDLFPPAAINLTGLLLAAVTAVATLVEGLWAARRPGGLRAWLGLLVELAVIVSLGWVADPLFSVGVYFLVWHGWRQMEPLTETVTGSVPGSWRALGAAVVRVHAAALPLLLPTWAAIGAVWWRMSATHSPRDMALVSIAAYLVVTPAHELLGDVLRSLAERRVTMPRRQPAAPASRNLPMARNFS